MQLWYFFAVRHDGTPVTGLTPTFRLWVQLGTRVTLTPPAVGEIGRGLYQFAWDAAASGDAIGQIDACGQTTAIWTDADRYIDVSATREGGAILATLGRTSIT